MIRLFVMLFSASMCVQLFIRSVFVCEGGKQIQGDVTDRALHLEPRLERRRLDPAV